MRAAPTGSHVKYGSDTRSGPKGGLGVLEGSGDIVYKCPSSHSKEGCDRVFTLLQNKGDSHRLHWVWTSFGFLVLSVRSGVAAGGT